MEWKTRRVNAAYVLILVGALCTLAGALFDDVVTPIARLDINQDLVLFDFLIWFRHFRGPSNC